MLSNCVVIRVPRIEQGRSFNTKTSFLSFFLEYILGLTYPFISLVKVSLLKLGLLTLTIHLFQIGCIRLILIAGPSNHYVEHVASSLCPLQECLDFTP